MADRFNPIRDLQPVDPFNVPVGESSEQVESIRLKLVVTRNKTAELVNILKKKNISFKKDIDTIRELNRRLMRTIPRIPILRGDASSQTNRLEEISKRRGQFDIDTTLIPKPDAKIPQRLLNFAVDIILTIYGGKIINAIFKRLGVLKLIKPKVLEKIIQKGDDFKIPIEIPPIKVPKLTPAQIKLQNIRRTLKEAETVIPLRKTTINRSNFFNLNNKERIIKNSQFTGPENLIQKLKQRSVRTIKNIYESTDKNIKGIQDYIRLKKENPDLKLDDIFPRVNAQSGSKTKGFSSNNKVNSPDKNTTTNMENLKFFEFLKKNKPIDGASLNRDTNTINNIYIVDDDFIV